MLEDPHLISFLATLKEMPIPDAPMLSASEADSPTKDSQENQRKHCDLSTSKQVLQLEIIEQHDASLPGTCETIIGNGNMNSSTRKPTEMLPDDSQQREDFVDHEPEVVPTNVKPTNPTIAQSDALQHQVSVVHHEKDIVPTYITVTTPIETTTDDVQQRKLLVHHRLDVVSTNVTPTTFTDTHSDDLQHQVSMVQNETDIVPTDITSASQAKTGKSQDLLEIEDSVMLITQGSDWSRFKEAIANHFPDSGKLRGKFDGRVYDNHGFDGADSCIKFQENLDREMVENYRSDCNNNITYPSKKERDPAKDFMKASYEREHKSFEVISKGKIGYFDAPFISFLKKRPARGRSLKPESLLNKREQNATVPFPDRLPMSADAGGQRLDRTSRGSKRHVKGRNTDGKRLRWTKSMKRKADLRVERHLDLEQRYNPQPVHKNVEAGLKDFSSEEVKRSVERKIRLRLQQEGSLRHRKFEIPIVGSSAKDRAIKDIERNVQGSGTNKTKKLNFSYKESQIKVCFAGSKSREDIEKDLEQIQGKAGKMSTKARRSVTSPANEICQENTLCNRIQPWGNVCEKNDAQRMADADSHHDLGLRQNFVEAVTESFAKLSKTRDTGVKSPASEKKQGNEIRDCVSPCRNECHKSDALKPVDADSCHDLGLRRTFVKAVTESFAKRSKAGDTSVTSPTNENYHENMLCDCVIPCRNDCDKSDAVRAADSDSHQDLGLRHNFVKAVTESFARLSQRGVTRKQSRSISKDAKSEPNTSKEVGQTEAIPLRNEGIVSESFIVASQGSFLELEAPADVPPLKDSDLICMEKFDADGTCKEKVELLSKREKCLPSKDTSVVKEHGPFSEGYRGKQLDENNPQGTATSAEVNLNNVEKDPWSAGQAAFPETDKRDVASDAPETASDLPEAASNLPEVVTGLPEAASNIPEGTADLPEAASGLPETFEMIEPFEETSEDLLLPSKLRSIYYKDSRAKKEKSTKKTKTRKMLRKINLGSLPELSEMKAKVPRKTKEAKLEYGRANKGFHRSLFISERQQMQNQGADIAKLTNIQLAVQSLLKSRQEGIQNELECTSSRVEISQTFIENSPTKVAESQERVVLEEDENINSCAAVSISQEDEQELLNQPFSISGCKGTQNQDAETTAFTKSPVNRTQIFIKNSPAKVASPKKANRGEDENFTVYSMNLMSNDKKQEVPHQLPSTSRHQGIQEKDTEVAELTNNPGKISQLSVENSPLKVVESGEGFSLEEAENVTEQPVKVFSCERESDCTQKNLTFETPAEVDACKGNKHGFEQSENSQLNQTIDDIKELGTDSDIFKSTAIRPNVAVSCSEEAEVNFHPSNSHVEFSSRGEDQKNLSEQDPKSDSRSKDGMKSRALGLSFNDTQHALAEVNKGNCRVTTSASNYWQPQGDASSANKFSLDSQNKGCTVSSNGQIDQQRVTLKTISMSPDNIAVDSTLKNESDSETSAMFSEVIKDRSNPVALSQNKTYDVMTDKFNQLCNTLLSDNLPSRKSQEHYVAQKEIEQCKDVAIERLVTKSPDRCDQLKEHSNTEMDNGESMKDPISNPTANESDCLESFTEVNYPYASAPQLQRNVDNGPIFLDKIRASKILDLAGTKDVDIPTISQQAKHNNVPDAQTLCHQQHSRIASSNVASRSTIPSARPLELTPPWQVMPRSLSSSVSSEKAAYLDRDSPLRPCRSPYLLRSQSDIKQTSQSSGSQGPSFQEQGKQLPLLRPPHHTVGAQLVAQPFPVNIGPQQARKWLESRPPPLGPWQPTSWLQGRTPPPGPQQSGSELDIRPPPLLYNTADVQCNQQCLGQRPGHNCNWPSRQRQTNPVQQTLLGNHNQFEIKRGQDPYRAFIPPRNGDRNARRFAFHPRYPGEVEACKLTHPPVDMQPLHPFQNQAEDRQRHDTDAVRGKCMQGDRAQYPAGAGAHRFNCHENLPVDNARCPKMTTVRAKRKRSEDNLPCKSKRISLKLQNSGERTKRSSVAKRHSCEPPNDIQLIRYKLPIEHKDIDIQRAFKCTVLSSCSKQSTVEMPLSQSSSQVKRAISDIGIRQSLKRIREIKHLMDSIHRDHNYAILDSSKVPKDSVGETLCNPKTQKDSVLEKLGDPKEPEDFAGETPGDPKNLKDSVGETHGDSKTRKDSAGIKPGDPKEPKDSAADKLDDPKKPKDSIGETHGDPKTLKDPVGIKLGNPKEPKDSAGDNLGDPKKPKDPAADKLIDPKKPKDSIGETFGDPKKPRDAAGGMMQTIQKNSILVEETQAIVTSELSFVKLSSDIVTKDQTASLTNGQSALLLEGYNAFSAEDQRSSSDEGQTAFSTECQSSIVKNLKEKRMKTETEMKSSFLNQNEVLAALSCLNEDFYARNDSASTSNILPGGFNCTISNNTTVSYTTPKNITLKQFDSLPGRFSLVDTPQGSKSDSNVDSDFSLKDDFKTAISSNEVLAKIRKTETMECFKMDIGSQARDGSAYQENSTKVSRCDSEIRHKDSREFFSDSLIEAAVKQDRFELSLSHINNTVPVALEQKQSNLCLDMKTDSSSRVAIHTQETELVKEPDTLESSWKNLKITKSVASPGPSKETTFLDVSREDCSLATTNIKAKEMESAKAPDKLAKAAEVAVQGHKADPGCLETTSIWESNIWASTSEIKSVPSTIVVPATSEQFEAPPKTGESLYAKKARLDGTEQNPVDTELQNRTRTILFEPSAAAKSVPKTGTVPLISELSQQPAEHRKSLSAKNRSRLDGTEQNPVDTELQNGTKTILFEPSAAAKSVPKTGTVPLISELSQQPAEHRKLLSAKNRSRLDDTEQSPVETEQQNGSRVTSAEAKSVPNTSALAGINEQLQQSPKSRRSLLFDVPIDRLNDELNRHCIMKDRFKIEFSCCFDFENESIPMKWCWKVRPDIKIESRTTQTDIDDICSRDTADKTLKSRLTENSKSYFSHQIQTNKAPISCQTEARDLSLPLKGIDRPYPTSRSKTSCSTQANINDRSYPACRDKACQVYSNMDDESRSTCIDKPSWPRPMEIDDIHKSDLTCHDRAFAMDSNMDDESHTTCTEKRLCACTVEINENSFPDSFKNKLRTFSTQTDEESTLCETGAVKAIKATGNHFKCCLAQSGDFSLCHNCVFSKGKVHSIFWIPFSFYLK